MQKTNLNVAPFYDDFDESKNFHRILFRPGFAVQGRELTQLQTILQSQVERFGLNIFKDGSPVTGGQTNLFTDITYLKLESTIGGLVVDVSNLDGAEIVETSGRGVRARVIAVAAEGSDPPTLMIRYVSGEEFLPSDTLALSSASGIGVAKVRSESDAIGKGSIATIKDGVFFTRGFFVHTPQQVVILDKYGITPTYNVGLEITESIITDRDDTSLLDPALDTSNYQAPGAARLQINLVFNKRTTVSTDLSEFIQLMVVQNGVIIEQVKYPIYNEIEKTLARRTYDQAGSYTVKAFRVSVAEDPSNNNNYLINVDPGKAYVFGFEFETLAPRTITVPKPRATSSVNSYALSVNFGNYAIVQNANGFFDTSTFPQIDLHCVPTTGIDFGNPIFYANSKIGTARIRELALFSVGTASQANTYQYRAHLFDVNTVSFIGNSSGVNCTISSINLASQYSNTTNAYIGAILTLTNGPSAGDRRTIISYDGTAKIATVDSNFSVIPTANTQYSIDFQFKDTESIAIRNVSGVNAFADIASSSKDPTTTFFDAVLTDTSFEKTIFQLPYSFIVATDASNGITGISGVTYEYRKVFTPSLTSNTATINLSGVEQFVGSVGVQSSLQKELNWFIVVTNPNGATTFNKGAVVPVGDVGTTITLTGTQTANVTVANGGNSTVSIIALINVTGGGRKTKTKIVANTTVVPSVGGQLAYDETGTVVPGVNVYASFGQIDFSNTAIIPKTSDTDLKLYIPDGFALVKVLQSANSSTPVQTSDLSNPAADITNNYTFDNGERDSYYAHSRIRLKPGFRPPTGQIRVFITYYDHDTNQGYFSVDSYPNANNQAGYAEIPTYTAVSGQTFQLRDVIDFRPRKSIGFANTFSSPVYIAAAETNFNLNFAYYLARIDNFVLTRDRRFDVVKGIDSLQPTTPKSRDDAMLLNVLRMPPYVLDAQNNISVSSIDNRRYTMRDIGALEKRITNLEYYTSLSLLEQQTLNKNDSSIQDDAGLERTKNGIIVDSFADFSACDLNNADFQASLDNVIGLMKPAFVNPNFDMFFYANGSAQYAQYGSYVCLPYDDTFSLLVQNLASGMVNINPFNVTKWAGTIDLSPPADTWVDTNTKSIVIDPNAGIPLSTSSVIWENWSTLYNGKVVGDDVYARMASLQNQLTSAGINPSTVTFGISQGQPAFSNPFSSNFTFSVNQHQQTIRTVTYEEIRTSQGTRILNTTIIPFIRSRSVNFSSKSLRPNTQYYAFFDGVDVLNYVRRANIIRLANTPVTSGTLSEELQDTSGAPDVIYHYDNYPPASQNAMGVSIMLTYAANVGTTVAANSTQGTPDYIKNRGIAVYANSTNNAIITQSALGQGGNFCFWKKVVSFEHYAGIVVSANSNYVTISNSAHSNANFFSPSIGTRSWANLASFTPTQWNALGQDGVVRIVSGKGAGQARQITGYNLLNNALSVNVAWTTVPDTTSVYSIGLPRSVETGHIGGTFHIPNTSILQFRTGDRLFKLTTSAVNDDNSASSFASGRYSASGTMEQIQDTVLVTRKLKSTTESSSTSTTINANYNYTTGIPAIPLVYGDPVAESFVVDLKTYPNGCFLSRFRTCFFSKDNFIPVRAQIRTMVNGFPNSTEYIEEVSLNSQYVKTTPNPSLTDVNKYTEFKFPRPVYLVPGIEYCIVLLSDSNQYNVFVSELGQTDITSGAVISKQPTLGSLFESQNGSTWTPVQEKDLMFSLHIMNFNAAQTANVNLRIQPLAANSNVDLFYFTSQAISPPGSDINYAFSSELVAGGLTPLQPFVPNITTYFNDQLGRRVLKAGSNSSFSVYASLSSTNSFVSPMIDISTGLSLFGIQYLINNGELSNSVVTVTNGGTGYLPTDNANITVSISGGGGSGAAAQVNAISNGVVQDIIITNPGSGYYATPSLTLNFVGNTVMRAANTNVAATIIGETSVHGGNALHRYIMQKVTLADGFDSSDIRVYLTGYKPTTCQIFVYYKVLSKEDTDVWDNKSWNVMTQLGNTLTSSKSRTDYIEMTFAPGSGGNPSNEIIYNGYSTFRNFAIKVVAFTTNPTDVAEFKDIRVIALPSGKVI